MNPFVRVLIVGLLFGSPFQLLADGFGSRRTVCAPVQLQQVHNAHSLHHVQAVGVAPVIAQQVAPIYAAPAAPIIVQNNYPPAPQGLGSTIYGYAADPLGAQALRGNPYQIDPSQILREAARLTDSSQQLTREALGVYQTLGADALGLAAQTEQLRARAALIEASKPDPLPASITSQQQQQQVQRLSSGGQTICITPDGAGGFTIRVEGETATAQQPQMSQPVADGIPAGVRVLQARCASCHTGPNGKGGLNLFSDATTFAGADQALADKILESVRSGAMPPATNAAGEQLQLLSETELAQLQILLGGS
jgi:mono/diheme cytochrome c family protein